MSILRRAKNIFKVVPSESLLLSESIERYGNQTFVGNWYNDRRRPDHVLKGGIIPGLAATFTSPRGITEYMGCHKSTAEQTDDEKQRTFNERKRKKYKKRISAVNSNDLGLNVTPWLAKQQIMATKRLPPARPFKKETIESLGNKTRTGLKHFLWCTQSKQLFGPDFMSAYMDPFKNSKSPNVHPGHI